MGQDYPLPGRSGELLIIWVKYGWWGLSCSVRVGARAVPVGGPSAHIGRVDTPAYPRLKTDTPTPTPPHSLQPRHAHRLEAWDVSE